MYGVRTSQLSVDIKSKMFKFNLIFVFVLLVSLVIVEAVTRVPRSPQFGQASASATAFGGGGRFPPGPGRPDFGRPDFGRPRGFGPGGNFGGPGGNFGGPGNFGRPGDLGRPGNFGRPGGNFGGPSFGPSFGPSRPGGLNVNIAKSVSISAGRGGGSSSAIASSRG